MPVTSLSRTQTWIFDLDNTLYPPNSGLFEQVSHRMTRFIQNTLELSETHAQHMRTRYFQRYGTTLAGLMQHHGIKADAFLSYVHDVDYHCLSPDPELGHALAGVTGSRVIYSNGSASHALSVLERLGITNLIDAIHDIADADYLPKPDAQAFRGMMTRFQITSSATATMFDDLSKNLATAAHTGMNTVLVTPEQPNDADAKLVTACCSHLPSFLQTIPQTP